MANKVLNLMAAFLIVSVGVVLIGCQADRGSSEKQARLLSAQNADLQRQLAAQQAEIQAIRQKRVEEIRRHYEELAACRARIDTLQKDIEKGIAERVGGVTTVLVDENARLRKEVEQLKTQIEELKKQAQP